MPEKVVVLSDEDCALVVEALRTLAAVREPQDLEYLEMGVGAKQAVIMRAAQEREQERILALPERFR
jgi:hypothetical protein